MFHHQFQGELAQVYVDSPKGQPPVPPAQLALASVLQAFAAVSVVAVIAAAVFHPRSPLLLHCILAVSPPFS